MHIAIGSPSASFYRYLCRVLLLCFIIPFLTSCESQKTIVNGLEEKEANEILVFLSTKGIDANKMKTPTAGAGAGKEALWDITVPEPRATEAMHLLNRQGLPRRRSQNLLSIFSSSELVPSDLKEKIKYRAGLSEQIASTIRKIDGVLDAEVNISFPEEDPLNPGQSKGKITASVYVKHSGILDDPNSHLLTKIKRLVAASVTGLDYDNVTVISEKSLFGDIPGGLLIGAGEEKQYVSIWSVIVAQESVTRFRMLFFSFSIAVLILVILLAWILWKVAPVLAKHGGLKGLFSIHPIPLGTVAQPDKKEDAKAAAGAAKTAKEEKSQIDKDIDET